MLPPPCVVCRGIGSVWQEKKVEKTKPCVLCSGCKWFFPQRAKAYCWHCHGLGETKYTDTEAGWIICSCTLRPKGVEQMIKQFCR